MTTPAPLRSRLAFWLRESAALLLWGLSLLKLLAFDFDIFLISRVAPTYSWILAFKLLLLLSLVSVAWLVSGHRSFLKLVAYLLGYPFVLLFWRVPRVCFRHWPIAITFAPALYLALRRLRSTVAIYTIGLVSAALVLSSTRHWLLSLAIGGLLIFQVGHMIRSLREAFGASLFADLARLTRKAQTSILKFLFEGLPTSLASASSEPPRPADPLVPVYVSQAAADIIAKRVAEVVRTRKYDIYLIASWLYTVALSAGVYALIYLGISRLDPNAFSSSAPLTLFRFLQLSIGILTTAGGSGIQAVSPLASLLCSSEYLHIPVILIILVFFVLTTQRETYRQDADDFRLALREFSEAVDARIAVTYQVTALAFEATVHRHNAALVRYLRRARGVPELPQEPPAAAPGPTAAPPEEGPTGGV